MTLGSASRLVLLRLVTHCCFLLWSLYKHIVYTARLEFKTWGFLVPAVSRPVSYPVSVGNAYNRGYHRRGLQPTASELRQNKSVVHVELLKSVGFFALFKLKTSGINITWKNVKLLYFLCWYSYQIIVLKTNLILVVTG